MRDRGIIVAVVLGLAAGACVAQLGNHDTAEIRTETEGDIRIHPDSTRKDTTNASAR